MVAKTKEVILEICPICGVMHRLYLTNGVFDFMAGKTEFACGTIVGYLDLKEGEKQPTPVLCGYKVSPRLDNVFVVKRWTYAKRIEYYTLMGAWKAGFSANLQEMKLTSSPEVVQWVLTNGTEKAPISVAPDKVGEENGILIEALHGAILEFNAPPLSQSSISQLQFIHQTQLLPRAMP
jgi:hypothetical protein